ncbi:ATP-binding cassette domain-containing protein [Pseudonocardia sp. KRD-184]|uniref:ABC transporter ATP-binding protein n=1 Tax=Pseudonocardia oceani TaxID=2792013 RepID=A0ABS6UGJ7_9PSEU|nr:ATP-binding cassette domain-containing protein [Pseudonocardia oceani]MBW0090293.1 ATP-binding cassette domain-containing protein [Pseudonocardia oceani]MBW0098469.1 ATP-binding cassette domain-containing protein [Pseudonocardia oceani]MBW0109926.1 ATP-binding cassette domain-containing protein [Pseudonocardia oceani]MBW0120369.1 ATP-binding cassette domain-containing protein [Pseudonocardia oceani]MBW0131377.1 ATP-binding cassette domain-containing protein [Pseudonocardia oceani]
MTPVLEARGLCFSYETGRPVLDGADLALHAGRRVAVLGPNGGGKTTLFRLLAGALAPGAGEVLLDGEPVRRTRRGLTALRTQVQLVLQDPDDQLFSASVGQDVSFGPVNMGLPADDVRARVDAALAALGITGLAERPTHMLSFGQKKRVAIAGAVAMAPRLLVLDEPTAGLDPAGVEELLDTLAGLHATGTTPVLSTHDVDLAHRFADEVAVVVDGRVVTGETSAVLGDTALLRAARLGPAWAPAVHRLLAAAGSDARPRTAAELHELLAAVVQTTSAGAGSTGAPQG